MRHIFWMVFCLITGVMRAQTVDSIALRQVDSLIQVSRTFTDKREFDKALEVGAAAEKLALEKLGRESAAYGSCCLNRGRINYINVNYPEAEKWYLEATGIWEKTLGKEHLNYARSLIALGLVYEKLGEYKKSALLYLEAKPIWEKEYGKEHPSYATILHNLALVYAAMGHYEEAESLYLASKGIWEKAYGKEHPDYASSLNNLANLYNSMGNREKAEPLFLESKAIREKLYGKEHSRYVTSLTNLAIFYMDTGDYEKAEPLLLEAKAIREKTPGQEHPDHVINESLANLYYRMGNHEKAEPLFLQVKTILEKSLGKEHPIYAASLNNLAALYHAVGDYEKAEPLHLEAKAIIEKSLGKEHSTYALNLSNLATVYHNMGIYEKAEPLFLEAKAIREKTLGKEHPDYANTLDHLALLYKDVGDYEKAEPLFLEAKAILEKALGREHPDYARSLFHLVAFYSHRRNSEKAEPLYIELSQVIQSILEKAVQHLSERELNNYLNEFSESQDQSLSFAQRSANIKVGATCFDNTLFYKGFLLQTALQIKRLSLFNPAAAENFNRLKSYERRLAAQYAQPIVERDSAAVVELETQVNDLEKELARTVAGYGQAIQQVKWEQVQAVLKPGEAAIELVSYRYYQKKQTDSTMYAALVLLPGADAPQFIPLFEEKQLAALLQTDGKPQPAFYNGLYAFNKKGPQVYDLVWKPIAAALPEGSTVYCSPSGLLHRLNLGAIPTPDGKTLAEKHHLTTLGSTRSLAEGTKASQLAVPSPLPAANQNATAQLYGGIQYDVTPVVAANTDAKPDDLAARRGPDFAQNDSTLRGENWNYLRWTEVEISIAAETMKGKGIAVVLKKGAEATEESFKALGENGPSPRILHVATHGFFFPDPKREPATGENAASQRVFKLSENPMIRSGLVLAGGNHAWKTGKPARPDLEDGILTAYEISQMNLSNTELVVLSACETGLGDLVGNEGVYGLQRAFKIAGARYLIMSLWQVPDYQTQVFMSAFYKHWLDGKTPVPEAFRATQSELRVKYGEAFKWAGFVLVE